MARTFSKVESETSASSGEFVRLITSISFGLGDSRKISSFLIVVYNKWQIEDSNSFI